MRNIKEIKEYWSNKVDESFVEFIEYLESDLKEYAILIDYEYVFSSISKTNIHNYIFNLKSRDFTDEEVAKIEKRINTYDEGAITVGVIHLGSIYVTVYGDS